MPLMLAYKIMPIYNCFYFPFQVYPFPTYVMLCAMLYLSAEFSPLAEYRSPLFFIPSFHSGPIKMFFRNTCGVVPIYWSQNYLDQTASFPAHT